MSKRKTNCANPHVLKLLEEWRDDAKSKGAKVQHAYSKVIRSLKKYPLPIRNGAEALILDGVGDTIARKLDEALGVNHHEKEGLSSSQHCDSQHEGAASDDMCVPPPQSHKNKNSSGNETANPRQKKQRTAKEYIPGYRTGAYALIITLFSSSEKPDYRGYLTKAELQREAQPLSETSFTLPEPGCHYTAWSTMGSLVKKNLVLKTSNPPRYSITDEGSALAYKLQTATQDCPTASSSAVPFTIVPAGPSPVLNAATLPVTKQTASQRAPRVELLSSSSEESDCEEIVRTTKQAKVVNTVLLPRPDNQSGEATKPEFVLKPGMFDVVLCVDVSETAGGSAKSSKDNLLPELKNNGVNFDVRKLQVGDFLWVARERTTPIPGCLSVPTPRELVLDYIAERKRMDDLCQSITDGRFREQKFRLCQCGLRQPIYLVEKFGSSQHLSLPESTIEQAIVNTQVVDGFFVKRTRDLKESVAYLTVMTRHLQKMFANKTLVAREMEFLNDVKSTGDVLYLLTFDEFNQSAVKNKVVTVTEMFGKQLMQVSGVSADKAAAILGKYPTPALLLQAYARQTSEKDRESMLSQLKSGKNKRNLGPAISKVVYQMYST